MWTLIVSTVKTQCNFTFYLCYLSVHKSSCIRISVHFLFIYCNFSLKYLDAVWVGTKRLRSFISSVMVVYTITNINCLFWIHVTLFVRTHCFRILMVTTPDFHHCCFSLEDVFVIAVVCYLHAYIHLPRMALSIDLIFWNYFI